MRTPGVLLAMGAVAAIASSAAFERAAHAQTEDQPPFGRSGQLVFSIPRLLPLVAVNSWSVQSSAATDAPTGTWVSFGNHPSGLNVYDLPRLGFDAVAVGHLTLGVDLAGYATLGASPSVGNPYLSVLGAAPHLGYVAPLAGVTSVWLRAGIAYYLLGEKGFDAGSGNAGSVPWSFTWHQLDADVEAHLVLAAFAHMAVTIGVVVEAPLVGRFQETRLGEPDVSADAGWVHVGVVGGLLTYL